MIHLIFVLKNGKIVKITKITVLMRVIVQRFVRGCAVRVKIKNSDKYVPLHRASGHFLQSEMTSDVQRSSADILV